jgi:hypothetical protein
MSTVQSSSQRATSSVLPTRSVSSSIRIAVHEAGQQGRQPVAADGAAGPDGQAATPQADELGDFLLGTVFQRENPLSMAINRLPAAGQMHAVSRLVAALPALEQGQAELCFEFAHRPRYGRLADVHVLRRPGKTACPCNTVEDSQKMEVHARESGESVFLWAHAVCGVPAVKKRTWFASLADALKHNFS